MFCNVLCLYSSTFAISILPLFKFSILLKTLSASTSPTLEKYCCIFIVFEKYTNLSSQRSPATGIPKETLVIHECSLAPKTMSKLQTNSNSSLAVFRAGKSFSSPPLPKLSKLNIIIFLMSQNPNICWFSCTSTMARNMK